MQMSPHNRRIRELLVRAWSPYLAAAMLLWGAEIAIFVGVARAFFPEVDLNSWTCIAAMTPPLLVALYVNFFVGTVLFVKAFSRRKGRAKAVHYLFPKAEVGSPGVIGRILLWATGSEKDRGQESIPDEHPRRTNGCSCRASGFSSRGKTSLQPARQLILVVRRRRTYRWRARW